MSGSARTCTVALLGFQTTSFLYSSAEPSFSTMEWLTGSMSMATLPSIRRCQVPSHQPCSSIPASRACAPG